MQHLNSLGLDEEPDGEEECIRNSQTEPFDHKAKLPQDSHEKALWAPGEMSLLVCTEELGDGEELVPSWICRSPSPTPEYNGRESGGQREATFDRQAPSRISTSPTLRRLRNNVYSPSQLSPRLDLLEGSKWRSWKGSTGALYRNPHKNPTDCPPSPSPWYFSVEPPSSSSADPEVCSDWLCSQTMGLSPINHTTDIRIQPMLQSSEDSLSPIYLTGKEGHSQPNTTVQDREECHKSRFYDRRRSSVVVTLPGLEVFPGDLLVSDGAINYLHHPALLLNSASKKPRWPFSRKGTQNKGKQKQKSDLENCLSSIEIADCSGYEYEFHPFKEMSWHEVLKSLQKLPSDQPDLRKQQEAMWELFTSECTYLLDHLLVLKMIFLKTLRDLQSHEHLLDVDAWRLFANLEELSQISLSFVTNLFGTVKAHISAPEATSSMEIISVLTQNFKGSLCRSHQTYCLNYTSAVFYLENLRQREDFGIYQKWCEQDERCKRLHLPELLVAPLHRLTRYPLLLMNIWKRSTDPIEKFAIYSLKEKVEKSVRELEGKVKWLDNFQKCRQLQEIIVWPPLWDRDKRFFIPECLKHIFKEPLGENTLSSVEKHLLHEGKLTLAESTRFLDVYLFLFDDFLLVTKIKRNKKKPLGSDLGLKYPSLSPELQAVIKEGGICTVIDQPIPLDRLVVKDIEQPHVSGFGLRNTLLVQHENRYQQCIAAFLLQAQTETIKKTWMAEIEMATSCYAKRCETKEGSSLNLPKESPEI
ncbi:pleckstrin homology domain-containing family G member 7 [Tachyglossus aculeatus]|uniref:pleckstrin homology domain-containing family G member 7 n=1 Tax=Tachyglossus aculeatus TaxID=9261 RepID=UPI0018F51B88|nr:pleckstrin homology domain-containing family G member 7 [Tachyglossus aculeatus]